jgi:hypothetical protein
LLLSTQILRDGCSDSHRGLVPCPERYAQVVEQAASAEVQHFFRDGSGGKLRREASKISGLVQVTLQEQYVS